MATKAYFGHLAYGHEIIIICLVVACSYHEHDEILPIIKVKQIAKARCRHLPIWSRSLRSSNYLQNQENLGAPLKQVQTLEYHPKRCPPKCHFRWQFWGTLSDLRQKIQILSMHGQELCRWKLKDFEFVWLFVGFDPLTAEMGSLRELGSSRDSTMQRDASLDVSYDERDISKVDHLPLNHTTSPRCLPVMLPGLSTTDCTRWLVGWLVVHGTLTSHSTQFRPRSFQGRHFYMSVEPTSCVKALKEGG